MRASCCLRLWAIAPRDRTSHIYGRFEHTADAANRIPGKVFISVIQEAPGERPVRKAFPASQGIIGKRQQKPIFGVLDEFRNCSGRCCDGWNPSGHGFQYAEAIRIMQCGQQHEVTLFDHAHVVSSKDTRQNTFVGHDPRCRDTGQSSCRPPTQRECPEPVEKP